MRTAATLEVNEDSPYAWLNKSVIIATGRRNADSVELDYYRVK
tara:strand:+ start:261 stop:389 length:129 start_codon:yes stop_codon:yes gene_type:complete